LSLRILKGERPERPRGVDGTWFTNEVWGMLEHCWKPSPGDRPRITDVLQGLENASRSWIPPLSQTVVGPPATDPLARISDSSGEESADESEVSSSPQVVPPHHPSWEHSKALLHNTSDYQDPGTSAENPKGTDLGESAGIMDWAPYSDNLVQESPLRRRHIRNHQGALPQSDLPLSKSKTADVEARELDNPALEGLTEEGFYGDVVVRERQQPASAGHPAGWLFRVGFKRGEAAGYGIVFFFSHLAPPCTMRDA